MAGEPAFLGTGWAFPPTFTADGKDVVMASGAEDIRQSLEILLATHSAERPFLDGFGCDLRQFLFEEAGPGLLSRIAGVISNAVLLHEPRILLHGVDVQVDETQPAGGRVRICLDYTIRSTNSRLNLVYPFHLTESAPTPG